MNEAGFLVTATKRRRDGTINPAALPRYIIVLSHETSRCVVNAYCSRRIGMAVLHAEPFEIEVAAYKPNGYEPAVYVARWRGKPGGGRDELRLEYQRSDAERWERVG